MMLTAGATHNFGEIWYLMSHLDEADEAAERRPLWEFHYPPWEPMSKSCIKSGEPTLAAVEVIPDFMKVIQEILEENP